MCLPSALALFVTCVADADYVFGQSIAKVEHSARTIKKTICATCHRWRRKPQPQRKLPRVTGRFLSFHYFLAGLAQPLRIINSNFLGGCRVQDRLHPRLVSELAERFPLLAQVRQVHSSQFLPQPPPEHLHRIEIWRFRRAAPKNNFLAGICPLRASVCRSALLPTAPTSAQ